MLKQHAILEIMVNERMYQLHLPASAPLGEVHDVLYQMRGYVIEKMKESYTNEAPKENNS